MKILKLLVFTMLISFITANALAQNAQPFVGVVPSGTGTVAVGCTLDLILTVGNAGITTIPVGKLRPNFTVPGSVTFLPNAQQTGLPTGWTILSNIGSQLRVCNTADAIPGTTNRTIVLKVEGVTIAPFTAFSGQINFGNGTTCAPGTSVAGNNLADDFSTSSVEVVAASTLTTSGTLSPFTSFAGTASAEQSFTVSGSVVTENIILTAPTDFEVSTTSGSGFGSSASISTPPAGTITNVPVYVRIAASAVAGSPSGNVVVSFVSATCGTPQNIPVSATVNAPLPLTLLTFSASLNKCEPTLNWVTESEINTDRFEIERSDANGNDWKRLGTVPATGTGAITTNYSFTDNNVAISTEKILYRLKMLDKDGKFKYSKILPLLVNCNVARVSVYPNPVVDERLYVSITGTAGFTEATLMSVSGQVILKAKMINGTNSINITGIADGIYVLSIKDEKGFQHNTKVVVKH